jgi:hypothetical protein
VKSVLPENEVKKRNNGVAMCEQIYCGYGLEKTGDNRANFQNSSTLLKVPGAKQKRKVVKSIGWKVEA